MALAACGGRTAPPAPASPSPSPSPAAAETRTRVLLSGPWRFRATQDLEGAEAPGFDDHDWETVQLPHTWGDRQFKAGWYRLANDSKALVFITNPRHVVYVPTVDGSALMMSVANPEQFLDALKQQ